MTPTPPVVWTEAEFLITFTITRDTLLEWIADGLRVLRCNDNTFRITAAALDEYVRGKEVKTPYLTADEAAKYIKRTRQAVYALVKRNRLKPCGGESSKLLFRREDLDRFIEGRGQKPTSRQSSV
jgi:excisionase family DNA binding protein